MPANPVSERRTLPRFTGRHLAVELRQRGKLSRTPATVLDFNRFGIAVLSSEPIPKGKQIFLTLTCGEVHLEHVIGVVHNCIAQLDGYRCGVQFRTRSELQFDKDHVEQSLRHLEAEFGRGSDGRMDTDERRSAAH